MEKKKKKRNLCKICSTPPPFHLLPLPGKLRRIKISIGSHISFYDSSLLPHSKVLLARTSFLPSPLCQAALLQQADCHIEIAKENRKREGGREEMRKGEGKTDFFSSSTHPTLITGQKCIIFFCRKYKCILLHQFRRKGQRAKWESKSPSSVL